MSKRFAASCSVVAALVLASCGGSSTSPSGGGTGIGRDGGTGGPHGATNTPTTAGAKPRTVTIAVGQTVTFINNDNRSHEMASDPHPQHGSCPSMEAGLRPTPPPPAQGAPKV